MFMKFVMYTIVDLNKVLSVICWTGFSRQIIFNPSEITTMYVDYKREEGRREGRSIETVVVCEVSIVKFRPCVTQRRERHRPSPMLRDR